jgi:Flp pilus assembly protein TadB
MTDLGTFIVSAALTLGIGIFLLLLLAPLVTHLRWESRRRRRRGEYPR